MKKRVLYYSFFVLVFANTLNIAAQSNQENNAQSELLIDDPNDEIVKSESDALKELLNLSDKQEYAIMRVLKITVPKKTRIESTNYSDKVQGENDLKSIMNYESDKFRQILSESQFKLYTDSLKIKG